jgi:hypothetical protein
MRAALDYVRRHVVAFAALFVALGGGAIAAIPDSGGVIHACYKRNGQVRIIDPGAGDTCAKPETSLAWNQAGRPGPPGPPSAAGGGVVARARSQAPVTAGVCHPTPVGVPLSGASWTQGPTESDYVMGEVRWTHDHDREGDTTGFVVLFVYVNGAQFGDPVSMRSTKPGETRADTFTITSIVPISPPQTTVPSLFEKGQPTKNVITAAVCNGGFEPEVTQTVQRVSLNVVGVR